MRVEKSINFDDAFRLYLCGIGFGRAECCMVLLRHMNNN